MIGDKGQEMGLSDRHDQKHLNIKSSLYFLFITLHILHHLACRVDFNSQQVHMTPKSLTNFLSMAKNVAIAEQRWDIFNNKSIIPQLLQCMYTRKDRSVMFNKMLKNDILLMAQLYGVSAMETKSRGNYFTKLIFIATLAHV